MACASQDSGHKSSHEAGKSDSSQQLSDDEH